MVNSMMMLEGNSALNKRDAWRVNENISVKNFEKLEQICGKKCLIFWMSFFVYNNQVTWYTSIHVWFIYKYQSFPPGNPSLVTLSFRKPFFGYAPFLSGFCNKCSTSIKIIVIATLYIIPFKSFKLLRNNCPAGNYMFKVNNRNTRTRCEICSKLTIKTPERRSTYYRFSH